MHTKKRVKQIIIFVVITIVLIIHLTPVFIVLSNSLRSNIEVRTSLFGLPTRINFENYAYVFMMGNYLRSYMLNGIVGFSTVAIVEFLIVLAAYGIVKLNAYGAKFFTGYFIAALSIPTFGILIPVFFIFNKIGLVNTLTGIILIFSATSIPFNFMFVRAFFIGIPIELQQAARIDGAGELQVTRYIILPLAAPILMTVALIVFTTTWNNFLIPTIFLSDPKYRLVSLNFYLFKGEFVSDLAYIFVSAVLSMIPIIILYMLFQRSFIEGMTKGGIKG